MEIEKQYYCKICNKYYTSINSLSNHNRNLHYDTYEKYNNKSKNKEDNLYHCRYCKDNKYNNPKSRWKHEQKCKTVIKENTASMEKILEEVEQLKKEILLKDKLIATQDKLIETNKLTKKTFKAMNKVLMDRSKCTNNYIQICNVGMENVMDVITTKDKLSVLNAGYNAIGKLTEIVHCGKYNQFKNVILTNMKGKYAEKYDSDKGYFVKTNQNSVIDDVYIHRSSDLQEIFDEFKDGNQITTITKRAINHVIENYDREYERYTDEYGVKYKNYKEYTKDSVIKPKLYNANEQIKNDIVGFVGGSLSS